MKLAVLAACVAAAAAFQARAPTSQARMPTALFAKRKGGKGRKQQGQQEKASVKNDRFESQMSKFMFTLQGCTKERNGNKILDNVHLSFYPGAKIGVVGINGAGKSTLLKVMAGVDKEFDGVARPLQGAKIGYLAQEPELEGETVMDCIEPAIESSRKLLQDYEDLGVKMSEDLSPEDFEKVCDDMAKLGDKIEALNLWELDRTVERAMLSLRVPPKDAKADVLSGGEKRRVALCRLLLEAPDLLLLDEPTNHLDAESVFWLEQFLNDFQGTVVAITHDRYFLENVAGWILELDRGKGLPFEGNYSGWLDEKSKRFAAEKQESSNLAKQVEKELEWVRQTPSGRGSRSKSRLKRYEELLEARDAAADREALTRRGSIYIPPGPRLGDIVVEAKGVRKSFGDKMLLDDVNFTIPPGAIVGIVGPNGAGKSTLLNMITGQDTPDAGSVTLGDTVKLVSVSQSRDELDPNKSVFEEITDGLDFVPLGTQEVNSRAYTSWFGFRSGEQQKKVGVLSGGERNRVQLAKTMRAGGNLILLDEPTNDLDVETMRSLEEALLEFGGSVICVSHDRFFLDRIATHILAFEGDSKVHFMEGNFEDYQKNKVERLGEQSIKPITYAPLVM
uniref:ABC transporter domain-containing protein n=1 Tax=Phaeomonas parva TaxID=124430 RepID=A0A7S1U3D9_9STRA|mmetsp:Transcript_29437/g.94532  ORF Transcript_29437/g.94532 Transcript_29437/m.94532 type:complete len:619 (+) Transcript_29437:108-1964(+)|eukprot:CAMPEP_0118885868 /NCGR_PEP_ID=MMETSP1163-20130328/24150_1 /TAXON_ID=124430 /ORGANISM="Phaeomonas parva, Strain CCMP2877" /LENGTH=618 /DNA_ID=CAMNT_0006823947 /DNA_START=45 /DNA_END=1901 /DNA_ORIENTATION=+